MKNQRISFIGAGNMAKSIIGGLVAEGMPGSNILACDPMEANRQTVTAEFSVETSGDNTLASQSNAIVLAVKPQVMRPVCEALAPSLKPGTLVVSIAAGVTCDNLQQWLGSNAAIVRCMPNTPALVKAGASALFASEDVSEDQKHLSENILSAVGIVEWVEQEALIDTVTAVSGSGPAYFFLFLEGMIDSATKQGLSPAVAKTLATQTALGAALLAQQSDDDIAELRRKVTSPGGTTEQAILSFENNALKNIIDEAMQACADRSRELATLN